MSTGRKWLIVLACAVAAIVLTALLTREREPSYQGKSLSEWLEVDANENADDDAKLPTPHAGAEAIRQMGTNALPFLLKWVRYDEPPWLEVHSKSLLARIPDAISPNFLQRWVQGYPRQARADYAAGAFKYFGKEARPAIPELTALMNNPAMPRASRRAVWALGSIGMDVFPILSARLADTNAPYRQDIVHLFWFAPALNTNEVVTVPLLVHCLEDRDDYVSSAAVHTLGRLAQRDRPQPALVVPALTNCFGMARPLGMRYAAAWALSHYGELAREALPVLLQDTTNWDERVRMNATNAILKIAPEVLSNAPPR